MTVDLSHLLLLPPGPVILDSVKALPSLLSSSSSASCQSPHHHFLSRPCSHITHNSWVKFLSSLSHSFMGAVSVLFTGIEVYSREQFLCLLFKGAISLLSSASPTPTRS